MVPGRALEVARQFRSCPKVAANRSPFFTTLHHPPQFAGFRLDPSSRHSIKSVASRGFAHCHNGFVTPLWPSVTSNMRRVRRRIRIANNEESVLSAPHRCSLTPIMLENEDAAPPIGQVRRSTKQVLHDLARVLARQAAREDYAVEQTTEGTSPCASPSMPGSALTSRTPDR